MQPEATPPFQWSIATSENDFFFQIPSPIPPPRNSRSKKEFRGVENTLDHLKLFRGDYKLNSLKLMFVNSQIITDVCLATKAKDVITPLTLSAYIRALDGRALSTTSDVMN